MSKEAVRTIDIVTNGTQKAHVDLIVGCCVADLIPPAALCCVLEEIAGAKGSIVYLPITFSGATKVNQQVPYSFISNLIVCF